MELIILSAFNIIYIKWALIFFLGAICGSFFYTLALRYIDGSFSDNIIKALFSTSRCQACKKRILPLYLIPILGYLFLKGKCKYCGNRISLFYPTFEIVYGLLLILFVSEFQFNSYSIILFLISGIAISISIIDVYIYKIPNSLIVVFITASIYPIILNNNIIDNLFGFILMLSFFILALVLFPGSFGGGDIKFASAIGLLLGLELSIVTIEAALVSGSVIGLIYAIKKRDGLKHKIPFAPFLTLGIITALLFGRDIVLIYYNIVY